MNMEDVYIPIAVFTFWILLFIRIFVFIRIWKSTWIKLFFTSTVSKKGHCFLFSLPGEKWRVTRQANKPMLLAHYIMLHPINRGAITKPIALNHKGHRYYSQENGIISVIISALLQGCLLQVEEILFKKKGQGFTFKFYLPSIIILNLPNLSEIWAATNQESSESKCLSNVKLYCLSETHWQRDMSLWTH